MKMAGIGQNSLRYCMGCNTKRPQAGSRGVGVNWRCVHCLRMKRAQKAGA